MSATTSDAPLVRSSTKHPSSSPPPPAADSHALASASTPFNSPVFHPTAAASAAAASAAAAARLAAAPAISMPGVAALDASWLPAAPSASVPQQQLQRGSSRPPAPSSSPPPTAAQSAQIARLQAALAASQQAHAAAAAQVAAQAAAQLASQQQAVYATPAAWHRHRQFLLNQPTPKEMPAALADLQNPPLVAAAASLMSSPPLPTLQMPPERGGGIAAKDASLASAQLPERRSAPSSASTSSSAARRSSLTMPRSGSKPASGVKHQRSFSSLPGTPSVTSPAPSAQSADAVAAAKLAHVQASLRHLKQLQVLYEEEKAVALQKSRIQRTFLSLSSGLIVLFVVGLAYYNYLILSPHIHALFWAGLFWVLLDAPQRGLIRLFEWGDRVFLRRWAPHLEVAAFVVTLALSVWSAGRLSALLVLGILFLLATFVLFGDRHTVTAVILLLLIMLLLAFPLFFLIRTCVLESAEIAARLRAFIEGNPEFQNILEDFSSSATFLWVQSYCRRWGYEIPVTDVARLREIILSSIVRFADQLTLILTGVYGLVSNMGNMLVSLVTFASCLYFLLAAPRDFSATLTWLSPFSADDNSKLLSTMKRSVLRIFVCSFCVGALHVLVTYVSFSLCGIDLCLILSFLSGFAAMLPVFSSWIIWLPACGGLLIAGKHASAALLAGIQLTLLLYVDPLILSNIPGDSYIIGMSIVFAVYTFGASGVLIGPLLAGLSFTFLTIYKEYLSMPLMVSNQGSTGGAATSPGATSISPQPTAGATGAGTAVGRMHDAAYLSALHTAPPLQLGDGVMQPINEFAQTAAHAGTNSSGDAPASAVELPAHAASGVEWTNLSSNSAAPLHATPSLRQRHSASASRLAAKQQQQSLVSPMTSNPARTLRFATPIQATPSSAQPSPAAVVPTSVSATPLRRRSAAHPRQSTPATERIVEGAEAEEEEVEVHCEEEQDAASSEADYEEPQEVEYTEDCEEYDDEAAAQLADAMHLHGNHDDDRAFHAVHGSTPAHGNDDASTAAAEQHDESELFSPSPSESDAASTVAAAAGSPLSLGSPSPSPLSVLSASPSPPRGAKGLAIELQRAHVESTHTRLIATLEAQLQHMQRQSQRDLLGAAAESTDGHAEEELTDAAAAADQVSPLDAAVFSPSPPLAEAVRKRHKKHAKKSHAQR